MHRLLVLLALRISSNQANTHVCQDPSALLQGELAVSSGDGQARGEARAAAVSGQSSAAVLEVDSEPSQPRRPRQPNARDVADRGGMLQSGGLLYGSVGPPLLPFPAFAWHRMGATGTDPVSLLSPEMERVDEEWIGHKFRRKIHFLKAKVLAACLVPFAFCLICWTLPWMYPSKGDLARERELAEARLRDGTGGSAADAGPAEAECEDGERPLDCWELIRRIGPLWPLTFMGTLAAGIAGPIGSYIGLNFFASHHTPMPRSLISCQTTPQAWYCREAVLDLTNVNIIIGFVSPVIQVLLGPALGVISDAQGRRRILVVTSVCSIVPMVATFFHLYTGSSLYWFFWLTPFADLPAGAVMYAYVNDRINHPPSIAVCFGLHAAAISICRLVGLVIGSMLTLRANFTIGFALGIAMILYVVLFLPESLPPEKRKPLDRRQLLPWRGVQILVRHALLARLAFVAMMTHFVDTGLMSIGGSLLTLYMNWTAHTAYVQSLLAFGSTFFWLGCFMSMTVRHCGELHALLVSRVACVVYGIFFMFATRPWHVMLLQVVLIGPIAVGAPTIAALKARLVAPEEMGLMQGALNTVTAISSSLGPVAFGLIFQATNRIPQFTTAPVRTKTSHLSILYGIVMTIPILFVLTGLPRLAKIYLLRGSGPCKAAGLKQAD